MFRIIFGFIAGVIITLSYLNATGTKPQSALNTIFDNNNYQGIDTDGVVDNLNKLKNEVNKIVK